MGESAGRLRPAAWKAAIALLFVAACLRCPEPGPLDMTGYVEAGEALLHGIPAAVSFRMPLATVLAALVSHHLLPFQAQALVLAAQAVLLLAACLLLFPAAGLPFVVALVFLTRADLSHLAAYPESVSMALVLLIAGLIAWRAEKPSKTKTFLLALAIGASLLVRSPLAFFPPLLALLELLRSPRPRSRESLLDAAILCVVPYVFLVPWLRLNWIAYREIVPFEYGAAYSNVVTGALGLVKTVEGPWENLLPKSFGPGDSILRWAAGEVARHPVRYLSAVARRAGYILSLHPFLCAAAMLGLWWRRRERAFQQLGLLAGYYLGIHCLMTVYPRYFEPMWPVLALPAAAAIARILPTGWEASAAARERAARAILVTCSAVVLALCVYVEFRVAAYAAPAAMTQSQSRTGALASLDRAVASYPDDVWLHLERGKLRTVLGDISGAAEDFSRALELRPGDGRLSLELAWTRELLGDASALRNWSAPSGASEELRFDASVYRAHAALKLGRASEAREHLAVAARTHEATIYVNGPLTVLDRAAESELRSSESGFSWRAYELLRERPDEERRLMFAALEPRFPRDARLRVEQARLAAVSGNRRAALEYLEQARQSNPTPDDAARIAALDRQSRDLRPSLVQLKAELRNRPADAELWLERAELEARSGDRAAALASAARAESPASDERSPRLFELYRSLKDHRRAAAALEPLLRRQPKDAGLWLKRAEAERLAGEPGAALVSAARAEAANPVSGEQWLALFELYRSLNDSRRARAALAPLIRLRPRDAGLRIESADFEVRAGERAAALKSLALAEQLGASSDDQRRRSVGLYRDLKEPRLAIASLELLLKRLPGDAGLWLERAELAANTASREDALRALGRAETANPDGAQRRRAAALYRRYKEFRRGLAVLKPVLENLPRDAGLWLESAELEADAGARSEALSSLSRAEASSPDDGGRRQMALLYRRLGESGRALAQIEPLLVSHPEDVELLIERAELEAQANRKGAALELLSRAEGLDADDELRRRLALDYQSLGEYGRAVSILDALIRLQPREGTFYSDRGLCEYLKGDAAAAVASLKKAIELSPAFIPAYLTLASIHSAKGRAAEALAVYDAGLANSQGGDDSLRSALLIGRKEISAKAAP